MELTSRQVERLIAAIDRRLTVFAGSDNVEAIELRAIRRELRAYLDEQLPLQEAR
jgi:hypothetical protein